jgi:hypothetical protein
MMVYTEFILYVDDDILPDKNLPTMFLDVARTREFSVLGVAGVRTNSTSPYTNPIHRCHSELYRLEKITEVDYVKGRIMFVKKKCIHSLWEYQHRLSKEAFLEDDISLNFSIQLETQSPSLVLPGRLFENLAGYEAGLHSDWGAFSRKRDATIAAFKRLGWKSLVNEPGGEASNFGNVARRREKGDSRFDACEE